MGSARTALYNWLVARKHGGTFILRIEDSDALRGRQEWVEGILTALKWLGLEWDEGPVFQSARSDLYRSAAERLFAQGSAYWCDCRREDIDQRAASKAGPPGYDGHCRDRTLAQGPHTALRFRTEDIGETIVMDDIRGEVSFANSKIEDFVLVRSNGAPLFLLCNVVDDIDQRITDVIRGEDHLPNTPKYQLLWKALGGGAPPSFAHLPMLVNEKRQKLSKRRDPVALEDYQSQGYLPEAVCNYLALLGWGPEDEQEVLSRDQLIQAFSVGRVNHSPAFFDVRKLLHFNGVWIRAMSNEEFLHACRPFIKQFGISDDRFDENRFAKISPLVKERVSTLSEVGPMIAFLFADTVDIDPSAWSKVVKEESSQASLESALLQYRSIEDWTSAVLEAETRAIAAAIGKPLRKVQAPLRLAVTGKPVGPPLFESMEVLGRDTVVARLTKALSEIA